MWVLDSVGGILFVVVYGVVVAVAIGGWWYCGFVCGVGVALGGLRVIKIKILMFVVFWCCKLVNCNICLVLCEFDFSNLIKISFPTRPTRETRLTDLCQLMDG